MKRILTIVLAICGSLMISDIAAQDMVIPLYPEGAIPNAKPTNEEVRVRSGNTVQVSNVIVPDIAVYMPARSSRTGEAIVICPGGGYSVLSYDLEGIDIAKYWNSKGIVAVVLKYRLPSALLQESPNEVPLKDVQRAMRIVRHNAKDWNVNPNLIGVMGFSAGGHLASSVSTHFDGGNPSATDPIERESCRPDFSLLIYPVITMTGDFQHVGSRKNLVGEDQQLMKYFSSELQVTPETPPAILIHASDDRTVPVENSIVYYRQLVKNNIPASLHIYSKGGHGFSLAVRDSYLSDWTERCYQWIKWLESQTAEPNASK